MALSYLRDAFGHEIPPGVACLRGVAERQIELVDAMLFKRLQTVETSSCGRLFDAVAAILGIATEVTFEGQAAIALETEAVRMSRVRGPNDEVYEFAIDSDAGETQPMTIDLRATIRAIAEDVGRDLSAGEISARFHNTLVAAIVETCKRILESVGLDRVCLSGGTFQNLFLLERTIVELRHRGFAVFLHALVPANDGGIALGQAAIANELLQREV
jgi:hydrogenase maturation protein HypF